MLSVATLSSCNDFLTIYPTDKTVGEDYWKTKKHVDEMVNGAYISMISYGNQEREIVWGAFRSDELVKCSSYSNSDLGNINAVNLLPTNGYNSWSSFYATINRCNLVLKHAPAVMDLDPEFTEGDYQVARAQMLALRSLCYFYLVRTFRDVPYTTTGYESDDVEMKIPQSTPDSVLQYCINDLLEAEKYIMKSGAYGADDWRNFGYFTRDAVDALLCDIYLWRASMKHSQSDYQQAIAFADKVIASKDAYYKSNHTASIDLTKANDIYHLYDGDLAFLNIFTSGNSRESILELQYDGEVNANTGLENYFYRTDDKTAYSRLMASQLFNATDKENANNLTGTKVYSTKNDYRYWNNAYGVENEEATQLNVRKFIGQSTISTSSTAGQTFSTTRAYEHFAQNWIIYRITDIMLMKAEAQVALAENDSSDYLKSAFGLVTTVNKRSLEEKSLGDDSLKFDNFNTKAKMELLVLAERERELCFEGKRWYDLVRYSYRHMDGVNTDALMADQTIWPSIYPSMLSLVIRKYVSGGDAVSYKMKTEPFLYFPIREGEIKVNNLLKQNPVYKVEETTSKK